MDCFVGFLLLLLGFFILGVWVCFVGLGGFLLLGYFGVVFVWLVFFFKSKGIVERTNGVCSSLWYSLTSDQFEVIIMIPTESRCLDEHRWEVSERCSIEDSSRC